MEATERANLPTQKAKQLCIGAASEAPAWCFAEAAERVPLPEDQAIRLCMTATSTEPAACAERLDQTTPLVSSTILEYCAALRWPLYPPGTGGSPVCIQAALERTLLTENQAARLCNGSVSAAPVACFELGTAQTALADQDLVDLCTVVVIAPPSSVVTY
jgi:hypothetical protein